MAISDGEITNWKVLHSDHFNIHFSPEQIDLATYILPLMVKDLEFIEDRIGYRLSGRIDVFLYPSFAHYLRSSHHSSEREITSIDGGIINVKGFDLPVFFDGNKANLIKALKVGIGENLITEMLYGGTVQERIKYHTLLNLPVWFEKGLALYLAQGWDIQSDDILRDLFLNEKLENFQLLDKSEQRVVGQSLWRYIDERKGDLSIPRILYLVRLTRKLETAFYFVFNESSKEIYDDWHRQYSALYKQELKRRIPAHSESISWSSYLQDISQVHLSPNSEKIIYVVREPGLYELRLWNRVGGSEKVLYSASTPVVENLKLDRALVCFWDKDGSIWLVDNTRLSLKLLQLNSNGQIQNEYELPFNSVHSLASIDQNEMILSASIDGRTDIYLFEILTENAVALTNDLNDEMDLSPDANGNFYFSANIYKEDYSTIGRHNQSDLFYCIRGFSEHPAISNITETPENNETTPIKIGKSDLSFLSDQNGIRNAYWTGLDRDPAPLTNYRFGIVEHRVSADKGHVIELMRFNNVYRVFISELEGSNPQVLQTLELTKSLEAVRRIESRQSKIEELPDSSELTPITTNSGSFYQTDFQIPDNIDSMESQGIEDFDIWSELGKHLGYKFKVDKLYSQIDNSYFNSDIFPTYLSPAEQLNNKFGFVLGVGLSDQRKRHHITGLMRSTLNFNQIQFRMNYRFEGDKYHRSVDLWRRSQFMRAGDTYLRNRAIGINLQSNRFLTDKLSLRGTVDFRKDIMLPLSTSSESLQLKAEERQVLNIEEALKLAKISRIGLDKKGYSTEIATSLAVSSKSEIGGQLSVNASYDRKIGQIGHYNSRLRSGFSLGDVQSMFILGGTLNEWGAKYNFQNAMENRQSYYYEPIFGMRGFPRNARNGNSFLLINNEIEFALSKIVPSKAIGNSWLNSTSFTGFIDFGSAWYGANPWGKDNPRNSRSFSDGLLDILVYNVKNPFIYSGGFGVKTSFYGYSIRYDLGWGLDNGVWNKAISHLSLGYAF